MTAILDGIYKQGKIDLLEAPSGLREGRVRVIVIAEEERPKPPPRMITFGMFQGDRMSTLEDFKDAEWHGEKQWDDRNAQ